MREASRDPDDLHGDETVFFLEIRVRRNGAMSVGGHIHEEKYALAVLDAARQTIKNHNARAKLGAGHDIIVPAKDTPWDKAVA